jgi:hypothetical protein
MWFEEDRCFTNVLLYSKTPKAVCDSSEHLSSRVCRQHGSRSVNSETRTALRQSRLFYEHLRIFQPIQTHSLSILQAADKEAGCENRKVNFDHSGPQNS